MSGDARDEVLARIRAALGNPQRPGDALETLEERIRAPAARPRPVLPDDRLGHFVAKAQANLFTIERLASLQLLVPAVGALMSRTAVAGNISVAPALAHLGWPADWTINTGPGRMVEPLSVTMAMAGIAETGSVVLRSDAGNPTTLNFLPDIHVVVLRASDVLAYPEDVWARMRAEGEHWPRAVNVVAGPSRTADVGGIIVRPAHGPKDVHLILIDG